MFPLIYSSQRWKSKDGNVELSNVSLFIYYLVSISGRSVKVNNLCLANYATQQKAVFELG